MNFFKNIETLEELKREYKKLALKLHPDLNKDKDTTKDFQEMQCEYEKVFEMVKNIRRNEKGEKYTKETSETMEEFKDVIDKIIHFKNVNIEIIGTWIWLTGDTKTYKDIIKELGFRWSKNKIAWYYHKDEFRKRSNKVLSLDDIREKFGSEKVQNTYQYELA